MTKTRMAVAGAIGYACAVALNFTMPLMGLHLGWFAAFPDLAVGVVIGLAAGR